MFYMFIGIAIGILIGSFFIWKRKIYFLLSLFFNSIIPVILFIIALFIDIEMTMASSDDPYAGTGYSFV